MTGTTNPGWTDPMRGAEIAPQRAVNDRGILGIGVDGSQERLPMCAACANCQRRHAADPLSRAAPPPAGMKAQP